MVLSSGLSCRPRGPLVPAEGYTSPEAAVLAQLYVALLNDYLSEASGAAWRRRSARDQHPALLTSHPMGGTLCEGGMPC